MAVDNSAAESARSLLNGIDYGALIGGPLQAAITAQAMAAKSTWEFIQQVGLNTATDGTRTAINVSFTYQRDGEMVSLIVPILSILPIPMIVIDEVDINFTANINASASSTSEDTKSQDIGGELDAEAKVGWGPFSLTARVKASYSSKQSSKATQDSRYSVEYTQNVRVHASQADMPAGLATVLNILSSAATSGTPNGELLVSPALLTLSEVDAATVQVLQISTRNASGLYTASDVTITVPTAFQGCFALSDTITGDKISWTGATVKVSTGKAGRRSLNLTLDPQKPLPPPAPASPNPVMAFEATIGNGKQAEQTITPIRIQRALPVTATLTAAPSRVIFAATAEHTITVTGTTAAAAGTVVTVAGDVAAFENPPPTLTLDADGRASGKFKPATAADKTGVIRFTATIGGTSTEATVDYSTTVAFDTDRSLARSAGNTFDLIVGSGSGSNRRRTLQVAMADRPSAGTTVRVGFDRTVVGATRDGNPIEPGDPLTLDERNTAQFEIELRPDLQSADAVVTIEPEDGPTRTITIPFS